MWQYDISCFVTNASSKLACAMCSINLDALVTLCITYILYLSLYLLLLRKY